MLVSTKSLNETGREMQEVIHDIYCLEATMSMEFLFQYLFEMID